MNKFLVCNVSKDINQNVVDSMHVCVCVGPIEWTQLTRCLVVPLGVWELRSHLECGSVCFDSWKAIVGSLLSGLTLSSLATVELCRKLFACV